MQKQIKGPSLKDTSQDSQDNDNGTPQQPDYSPLGLRALDETSEAGENHEVGGMAPPLQPF